MPTGDIGYTNETGKVFCNKNILLSVINLAAKEISGVASMCNNFSGGLKKFFSGKYYEGVKVEFGKQGADIDVYINVYSSVSVPDVASRMQENIKNSIASMIATLKINQINVHVLGVDFQQNDEVI